jgi:hypothetical protein
MLNTARYQVKYLCIYLENVDLFYIIVSAEVIECDFLNSHSVYHVILAMVISPHFVLS